MALMTVKGKVLELNQTSEMNGKKYPSFNLLVDGTKDDAGVGVPSEILRVSGNGVEVGQEVEITVNVTIARYENRASLRVAKEGAPHRQAFNDIDETVKQKGKKSGKTGSGNGEFEPVGEKSDFEKF